MKALFLIGAVAKRPRPVRERPIRKALLRAISGIYDDSRPCNHIGAGARLISQPRMPEPLLPDKGNACAAFAALPVHTSYRATLVIVVKVRPKLEFARAASWLAAARRPRPVAFCARL